MPLKVFSIGVSLGVGELSSASILGKIGRVAWRWLRKPKTGSPTEGVRDGEEPGLWGWRGEKSKICCDDFYLIGHECCWSGRFREHPSGFCLGNEWVLFFNPCCHPLSFHWMFNVLTFKVITDKYVFIAILLIVFYLFFWFLSVPFFSWYLPLWFAGFLRCFVWIPFSLFFVCLL